VDDLGLGTIISNLCVRTSFQSVVSKLWYNVKFRLETAFFILVCYHELPPIEPPAAAFLTASLANSTSTGDGRPNAASPHSWDYADLSGGHQSAGWRMESGKWNLSEVRDKQSAPQTPLTGKKHCVRVALPPKARSLSRHVSFSSFVHGVRN